MKRKVTWKSMRKTHKNPELYMWAKKFFSDFIFGNEVYKEAETSTGKLSVLRLSSLRSGWGIRPQLRVIMQGSLDADENVCDLFLAMHSAGIKWPSGERIGKSYVWTVRFGEFDDGV